jgi:GAF domain-containing protein
VLDARTVHIADVQVEAEEFPEASENARRLGFHTMLSVPLMREGVAIGAIQLPRTEVRLFTERQVALLKTFADQAVIAVENVRLFKELEARNHDLTEALEQQTATAEILRVISRSQTDVQPVFDTIVRSAVRLCDGLFSALYKFDGELIHFVAHHNYTSGSPRGGASRIPCAPNPGPLYRPDDPRGAPLSTYPTSSSIRSTSIKPCAVRSAGEAASSSPCCRRVLPSASSRWRAPSPGPFSDSEIELLKTFADQAVIAIENVRTFTELEEKTKRAHQAHAQVSGAPRAADGVRRKSCGVHQPLAHD